MVSVEVIQQILNDPSISAEEAEKIRDDFRALAEIIFEKWQHEHQK